MASPDSMSVVWETLLVPFTTAATSAGLSGSQPRDPSMVTSSMTWDGRQLGCKSGQGGSTFPNANSLVGGAG